MNKSGVQSRNSERAFNYALGFAGYEVFPRTLWFLLKEGHRFLNFTQQNQRPCKVAK